LDESVRALTAEQAVLANEAHDLACKLFLLFLFSKTVAEYIDAADAGAADSKHNVHYVAKRIINNAAARKSRNEVKLDVFYTARRRDFLEMYAASLEVKTDTRNVITASALRNYNKMAVIAKAVVGQMQELDMKARNLQRRCDELQKAAPKQQE
jgi:hypothetical protein